MAGRSCIFCGSLGPLTREHVYPKWLLQGLEDCHYVQLDPEPMLSVRAVDETERFSAVRDVERPIAPSGEQVVRMVCGSCNSGWMSGSVEEPYKAVFERLVQGGLLGSLTPEEAVISARWALKTLMVHESALGQDIFYSALDRAQIMRGLPPALTDVWVARSENDAWGIGVYAESLVLGRRANGTELGASIEVLRAGPFYFLVRRADESSALANLLLATYHFSEGWRPLHSRLPWGGFEKPVSEDQILAFLESPFSLARSAEDSLG